MRVVGVHIEVVKQQFAVLYVDRTVVKPQFNAVGDALDIRRVKIHFAVNLHRCQRASYLQSTVAVTFKPYQLVWHKTVDKVKRQFFEVYVGIKRFLASHSLVSSLDRSDVVAVMGQYTVNIVSVILKRYIHELRGQISHRTTLVVEVINAERG